MPLLWLWPQETILMWKNSSSVHVSDDSLPQFRTPQAVIGQLIGFHFRHDEWISNFKKEKNKSRLHKLIKPDDSDIHIDRSMLNNSKPQSITPYTVNTSVSNNIKPNINC